MPLKRAKTFKEEEYWANLYGETIATPNAALPPATPEPEPEAGNLNRGLRAGFNQTQGLGGGLVAAVGSVVGSDKMVAAGMETYQRNMAEAEEFAGDVMAIEEIDSVGDFGSWAAYTLGTIVPDLALGGVGAFAGKAVAKQVVKNSVKEFAEKEGKDVAEEALKAGVEKDAAEFIAREVAEKTAITQTSKAAVTGAVSGAVAYSAPTLTGGSFANILEETGVEAPFTALGVGVVGAGLEVAPFMKAFRGIFPDGGVKKFKDFVAGSVSDQPSWMRQAFAEIVKAQGVEGGTEALQFLLEESAITFVNNNYTEEESKQYFDYLSNERKRSGLLNSAAAGILMGSATGAGTVGVKTFTDQYKAGQSDAAGKLRTEANNDPELRSKIIEVFSKYENADANNETVLTQPTEDDIEFLNQNEPLTPEQRKEAGLSELTDYDGNDMVIPEGTEPDVVAPEITPVTEAPQQAVVAEDSLPQAPTADIVTDFESAPAFGERPVPANSTESGTLYEYHNFEGQLSDPAKPVTDQLVELSVAANTPEALDSNNTDVVVEAIDVDDVDRMFDRNDFLKVETNDKPRGKSLPTVDESFGENSQEATNVVAGVVADLSASGVPKSFLDAVTGIYVHKESELDVPALTGNKSRGISINSSLVSGAVSDPKQLSELAWSMTHEVYHAADFSMGLSDKDPQFGMTIVSERDQPTVVMGDVMDEIFTNWENRTELGKRFDYPFNDLQKEINDRDKPNEGLDKSYRQEVFAQLGAMFHSNPMLLQEQSPLAYNFIKGIRDNNLKTNNVPEIQSEETSSPSDQNTTESTGLRGQVRAPPESGSVESAPVNDIGSDGEGSTGVGRTDSAVEGQAQEEAGERERPAVQEPDVELPTTVNLPLDPYVNNDTSLKAYRVVTDHPEGKLKLTEVRKKFKKLEDNQFDQMIADLIKEEGFSLDDGVLSDPETVKLIEEERLADERMMAEDAEFQSLMDDDLDDPSFIKKKQNNAKNNTLDDGSPSTSQFSFKDEIDGQSDLRRRFNKGRNPTVRSLSDRYDTLKQLEDQAADYLEVGRIPASMSPRDQENLSHGKVQDDLDEFHKTYVDVIGDLIHKSGIDPESIGVYLLAKHAQERNANVFEKEKAQREKNIARTKKEIQKLEDDVEVDHTVAIETQQERLRLYETMPFKFEDSGSGMTNGEAQSVLNTAEREGTKAQMEEIASKVYKMLQFQRDRMVKAGLLDEVSKADWEDTFKFYVPLKGFAAEESGDSYVRASASRGFSIVGSESMKAKGRKTLPVNPLLTAIEDVQKKIIRARKNETAQTLLDLLSNLGTSDSYVIYNNKFRPPMESDPLTMQDLKSMSRDRRPNGDPKYVEVKKGGQTFFIYFKSDSLNHSLQNMSVPLLSRANESVGKLLTFATRFQTFRRNMLINYNPSWGLVNPIRDIQTALMYGLAEMDKKGSRTKGKNIVGGMAKTYLPAMRSLYRYYREKPVREGNQIDQYTQDFHDDGAQTGLMLVKDQAEQLRILKSKLKKGYTREAIRSLLKFVEDFNTTMENSVRLAAYAEARKAGAPREDAATLAKDITVNFNRKGEDTATVNAMYLFFNAAVQGNVNIMQALGNDGSSGKRFTTAQKTAAGLVAIGSSLALMNILNSEDDDDGDKKYEDLPEHAKNRSLLIMGLDGEEGFALPAPYGYNFFTNIGRYGTELAMGVTEIEDVGVNLFDNILLNFVPITPSAGDGWAENVRGFYPDLLELHQDLVANKNFFGSDIAVEQNPLFVKRSQSYVAKRNTGKNFKEITKFMNDATGGDEFEDGLISFSPDRMQYAYSYFFGGLGRSASQAGDVMGLMAADEEVRRQDMPVISTFFKRPSEYEDRFEYYDNWEEIRQMKTQITQTTDPKELEDLYKRFKPYVTVQAGEVLPVLQSKDIPNLYDLANKNLIAIRKQRKLLEKIPQAAITEDARKRKADEIDKKEALVFDLFNKAYRKAEKKANN